MVTFVVLHWLILCFPEGESQIITHMDLRCWGEAVTDWLLGRKEMCKVSEININSPSKTLEASQFNMQGLSKNRTPFTAVFISLSYLDNHWSVHTGTSFFSFRMGTLGGIVDCLSPGPFLSALCGELSPFPRTAKTPPCIV